jgi:retron-type reverse transcriptase
VSPGLDRVRTAARLNGKERFTALLHHAHAGLLRRAYFSLKRDAAAGVDGITWQEYGEDLEPRLADLHARFHRGAYRAQPSRRHYIPKPDGRQCPLGIAALEDKIVQATLFASASGSTKRAWN